MNLFESLNITATPETPHSITLIANNGEQKVYGRLTDDQMKQFVELFLKLGVTPTVEQKTKATLSEQSKESSSSKKTSSSKKSGKASSPKKSSAQKPFWSYVENAPLTGSVKLSDFYEVTSSKSGHQAVIEVSKELAPCWWYFLNACVREYNEVIAVKDGKDADLFPLKSCGGRGERKLACDRKVVNGGAAFMFADAESSTASINRFIGIVNGYLTKTGNTSVSKGKALYAKADAERKAEYDARKAQA